MTTNSANTDEFTFGVRFMGSTETGASATDARLLDYAQRCKAAEWAPRESDYYLLSLSESHADLLKHEPNATRADAREKLAKFGHTFFPSREDAEAAAQALCKRGGEIIDEVYGADWRDNVSPRAA
jgi:hypothetical protein